MLKIPKVNLCGEFLKLGTNTQNIKKLGANVQNIPSDGLVCMISKSWTQCQKFLKLGDNAENVQVSD